MHNPLTPDEYLSSFVQHISNKSLLNTTVRPSPKCDIELTISYFADGKIYVRGKLTARGARKRADYILYFKPNIPMFYPRGGKLLFPWESLSLI